MVEVLFQTFSANYSSRDKIENVVYEVGEKIGKTLRVWLTFKKYMKWFYFVRHIPVYSF